MESKPMELPKEWEAKIQKDACEVANIGDGGEVSSFRNGMYSGYRSGALAYAPWLYTCQQNYAALKLKYDNILATESGHENKTENVWQSGYASGHEAAEGKINTLRTKCDEYEDLLNRSSLILMSLGYAGKLLIEINEALEEKDGI